MQSIICQRCGKRPATTHLTELSPTGARDELHLCATCLQQLDLHLESGPPPIAGILHGLPLANKPSGPSGVVVHEAIADCPRCGMSFSDFESHKRFGCSHDYTVWEERLVGLLDGYHGTDRHVGRQPGAVPMASDDLRQRHLRLDAALRSAVASEDFESAARLRDELRRLERPTT
jgi:protein arginine kinase activator